MNLDRCKVISTVEFGSTFQGTADAQSDVDLMTLVVQPLTDTVFRNHEKSAVHKDDIRYYPVERFIRLIEKVSFDSVLILTAQLIQAKDTNFNKHVIGSFYNENLFTDYILANLVPYGYSIIGNMNNYLKKDVLTGKEYVKLTTFQTHLQKTINLLEDIKDNKTPSVDY